MLDKVTRTIEYRKELSEMYDVNYIDLVADVEILKKVVEDNIQKYYNLSLIINNKNNIIS